MFYASLVPQFSKINQPRWRFSLAAVLITLLVFCIPFSNCHFDITHFIVAGDKFVSQSEVPTRIEVLKNSDGYDGQYYFRLAIKPNAKKPTEIGITIDRPAFRMQRIGYSVLGYIASGGDANLVPYALVALNFCGIAAIAWFSQSLRQQLALPAWFPIAVMAWPGYFITLVHDTTEIVALAFMLAAISAYFARHFWLYAVLAAAATLTRETSIMVFGGLFAFQGLMLMAELKNTRMVSRTAFLRCAWCLLALLPFLAWRHAMAVRWGDSPMTSGSGFIGYPLLGIYQKLAECIAGTHLWAPNPVVNKFNNVLVFLTVAGLTALAGWVAIRLPQAVRGNSALGGLAMGWAALSALLFSLTSIPNGPWVDMTGDFRICTEFWAVSMLLLASTRPRIPKWVAGIGVVAWISIVAVNV